MHSDICMSLLVVLKFSSRYRSLCRFKEVRIIGNDAPAHISYGVLDTRIRSNWPRSWPQCNLRVRNSCLWLWCVDQWLFSNDGLSKINWKSFPEDALTSDGPKWRNFQSLIKKLNAEIYSRIRGRSTPFWDFGYTKSSHIWKRISSIPNFNSLCPSKCRVSCCWPYHISFVGVVPTRLVIAQSGMKWQWCQQTSQILALLEDEHIQWRSAQQNKRVDNATLRNKAIRISIHAIREFEQWVYHNFQNSWKRLRLSADS